MEFAALFAGMQDNPVNERSNGVGGVEPGSLTFCLTTLQVKRTLALGNLLPRIRNLYRAERIDTVTVRHLALVTKKQQRDWLALLDSENDHVPMGQNLKSWLMGSAAISTKVAVALSA